MDRRPRRSRRQAPESLKTLLLISVLALAGCHPHSRVPDAPRPAAARYDALGSGHLLRAVAEDGRYVTLEDGSRWEVHPRDRFRTIEWEPDSGISVRTTRSDDGYAYEIVNTTLDDGVLAKYIAIR